MGPMKQQFKKRCVAVLLNYFYSSLFIQLLFFFFFLFSLSFLSFFPLFNPARVSLALPSHPLRLVRLVTYLFSETHGSYLTGKNTGL